MSVWGTGGMRPHAEAFLDGRDHRIHAQRASHRTSPKRPPDLPGGRAACLARENHLPGRLPFRVTPALTYRGYGPRTATTTIPKDGSRGGEG